MFHRCEIQAACTCTSVPLFEVSPAFDCEMIFLLPLIVKTTKKRSIIFSLGGTFCVFAFRRTSSEFCRKMILIYMIYWSTVF